MDRSGRGCRWSGESESHAQPPEKRGKGGFPEQSDRKGPASQAGRGEAKSRERVNDRGHSAVLLAGSCWGGAVGWPRNRPSAGSMGCTWGGPAPQSSCRDGGHLGLRGISPVFCVYD